MKFLKSFRKGVSLPELLAVIIVLSIAVPTLLSLLASVTERSSFSEEIATAGFYAQELMEEIRTKRYDEEISTRWTSSGNFGVDAGENAGDRTTFDDVDDYVGCTHATVTSPATGYSRSVTVEYVMLDVNDRWQPCGTPVNCIDEVDCTSCNHCCYKRVTVSVVRNGGLAGPVNLELILSSRGN